MLGPWRPEGLYIREGIAQEGTFFDTGGPVWQALEALSEGNVKRAVDILAELNAGIGQLPPRLKEARWLMENGYTYVVEEGEGILRWVPRETLLEVGE